MSAYIRMRHPNLPPEQTITVAEQAVPHHAAAGWVVADDSDPQPADEAPAETPEAEAPASPAARKRRRAPEGE